MNGASTLEFELAYLTLLTRAGLKPLSRWEKPFDVKTRRTLESAGLQTRVIERSVRSGRRLQELVFSPTTDCLDLYSRHFEGKPVSRDSASTRVEGLLFGYPQCCVETFLSHPYARNSLPRCQQRILFYWACPGCKVTPLLMPDYRRIYQQSRKLTRRGGVRPPRIGLRRARRSLGRMALAASLLASVSSVIAAADPHCLSSGINVDTDADYLSNAEETILGWNPADPDQNGNSVPDGVDLAKTLSGAMELLPSTPSTFAPYVLHHMAFGLENCQVCGAITNMGLMEVVNPLENQTVSIPYIAAHFLEHGSFSYSGTVHAGRINPSVLQMALASEGFGHFISEAIEFDGDNDGLRDAEEPAFRTDPAIRDTNKDQVIDGIEQGRLLRAQLDALPRAASVETGPKDRVFVVEHPMNGLETCPRCGDVQTMGTWDVVNPVTGSRLTLPTMGLHYLRHGGFAWEGGGLMGGRGRVDPRQLQAVLTGLGGKHLIPVDPDADQDLLTDLEELELRSDPLTADEDGNQVADGVDLARDAAGEIALLPTQPAGNAVYRLDFPLRGLEQCAICGTNVNMGHLTVCNPAAGLYAKVPYIELHFLEHGGFSFSGHVHGQGRAPVRLLMDALRSKGPSHLLPLEGDADSDGLLDGEELQLGTSATIPDTDADGVPDGFALALDFWQAVGALPRSTNNCCYVVEYSANGVEPCSVCGEMVNMGFVEIINPGLQLSLTVPYLALHFMERGSFSYADGARIDPVRLEAILRPRPAIEINGDQVTLRWTGLTSRSYQVYTAPDTMGPWSPGPVFQGGGAELRYTEPRMPDASQRFYKVVAR